MDFTNFERLKTASFSLTEGFRGTRSGSCITVVTNQLLPMNGLLALVHQHDENKDPFTHYFEIVSMSSVSGTDLITYTAYEKGYYKIFTKQANNFNLLDIRPLANCPVELIDPIGQKEVYQRILEQSQYL